MLQEAFQEPIFARVEAMHFPEAGTEPTRVKQE